VRSKIFDALLCDHVSEIIFLVICPVSHHFTIYVQRVVIEAGVPDQTRPVIPSGWDPLTIIVI